MENKYLKNKFNEKSTKFDKNFYAYDNLGNNFTMNYIIQGKGLNTKICRIIVEGVTQFNYFGFFIKKS